LPASSVVGDFFAVAEPKMGFLRDERGGYWKMQKHREPPGVGSTGEIFETTPRPHGHAEYGLDDEYAPRSHAGRATLRAVEDYTSKYKGEQVEVALFGGEYQEGVLTAYCYVDEVAHIELNGHILVPLQNIASLHCSSRCDAPQNEDWPPRGLLEDDGQEDGGGDDR
jgi:hypothetical protein